MTTGGESDARERLEACVGVEVQELGVVNPHAEDTDPCRYCGVQDGHTGQCPVVS